jgi:SAM-dependent methyltransferase/uncharacterized protein YbaR (Trm112 family)
MADTTRLLDLLRCPGCRSAGLLDHGTRLECRGCGRVFPVQADIPVLVSDAVPHRAPLLDPALVAAVMQRLGIPVDPITTLRVRRASGARVRLQAGEGGMLPQDGAVLAGLSPDASPPPRVTEGEPRSEWLAEYLPRAMRPGEELLANVRFRNTGATTMGCTGEGRFTIGCRWDGGSAEDVRTPLPIDVAPGQALTLALRLRPPAQPGQYSLSIAMVQEGVRWLPPFGPFSISVRDDAGLAVPPSWVVDGPGPHEPDADRARGLALLADWMTRYAPARPRVLELGGGATPAAAQPGYDTVVADTDLLALQLGLLVPRRPGVAVQSFCADLADLPLNEAAFDAAICFGSLHTMPDPALTLRNLRCLLRPGGFIGLFCEPVGHIWPGAASQAALAKLRRGVNVQGFSVNDYDSIIRCAHLRVTELVVDGASLKARLEPES